MPYVSRIADSNSFDSLEEVNKELEKLRR
jgi:hypothetical protein